MVAALRSTKRCSSGAAAGTGASHSQIATSGGEQPLGPYPGGGLDDPLAAGQQQGVGGLDVERRGAQVQPDPGGVDGPAVPDDDQGVGELVHHDGGEAQADDHRDLRPGGPAAGIAGGR